MSYGVGHRGGSDPTLRWLWRRPVTSAPIWPLAWEPPYAAGEALKKKKMILLNIFIGSIMFLFPLSFTTEHFPCRYCTKVFLYYWRLIWSLKDQLKHAAFPCNFAWNSLWNKWTWMILCSIRFAFSRNLTRIIITMDNLSSEWFGWNIKVAGWKIKD